MIQASDFASCSVRSAHKRDRWKLQWLVWQFITEEARPYFWNNLIRYSLRPLCFFILAFLVQLWLFFLLSPSYLQGILLFSLNITLVLIIGVLLSLIRLLFIMLSEAVRQWSNYSVIECQNQLVACGAIRRTSSYSVIYNIFVLPQWRNNRLGSTLVQTLTQKAYHPLYLACKTQRLPFYRRLEFVPVHYNQLPRAAKQYFVLFQPQLQEQPPSLYIMQHTKS